jgi:hypothetical protein
MEDVDKTKTTTAGDSELAKCQTNNPAGNPKQCNKNRKRKRTFGESLSTAYASTSFVRRESTGRPDSPHFFFSSSYSVTTATATTATSGSGSVDDTVGCDNDGNDDVKDAPDVNTADTDTMGSWMIPQVVHSHVNGLCVVTAGDLLSSSLFDANHEDQATIQSIRFVTKEAPACSAAEKRKRQAKMLKGGKVEDVVAPSTVIAELIVAKKRNQCGDDSKSSSKKTLVIPLRACVWGTILELNTELTPTVLMGDPLLDGYLAIILPSGKFPPNSSIKSLTAAAKMKPENDVLKTEHND